jgi:hypothetical protein
MKLSLKLTFPAKSEDSNSSLQKQLMVVVG